MLEAALVARLEDLARERSPLEAVACIRAGETVELPNVAEYPEMDFQAPRAAWRPQPGDILWHSHPHGPAWPSPADMRRQAATAVAWAITALDGAGHADTFLFGDQAPVPSLVGRHFRPGVTDCYGLVRDWYRQERGTALLEVPRLAEWWAHGEDLIGRNFARAGFARVPSLQELEPGDVLFFKIRASVVNHLAVYVGDGMMIHHLDGRLSRHDSVEPWLRFLAKEPLGVVRHVAP